MNDIIFGGVSLNSIGFAIKTHPTYRVAERDLTFHSVIGRDGDFIIDNKRYKNVEMLYSINSIPHLVSVSKDYDVVSELINFTRGDGEYRELRDDFNKGYFCKAVCTSIGEIMSICAKCVDTTVNFSRQPYWYSDKGQEIITLSSAQNEIRNPEAFSSEPLIRVYGADILILTINGRDFKIRVPSNGYIDLDTELQSAFVGKNSYNKNIDFDYMPIFKPGVNSINVSAGQTSAATFERLEIIPRWRRL